jgi:hypothetical protein
MLCTLTPSGAQSRVYKELSTIDKNLALQAYNFVNNSKYFDYQSQLLGLDPKAEPLRHRAVMDGFDINPSNIYDTGEPKV